MTANTIYSVTLESPTGVRIDDIPHLTVDVVRSTDGPDVIVVDAPMNASVFNGLEPSLDDHLISIHRRPVGLSNSHLETRGFIRGHFFSPSQSRQRLIAFGGRELLARRIVNGKKSSAVARKVGTADDVMKVYVRESIGSSAPAARVFNQLAVDQDRSVGPSVTVDFATQWVLDAVSKLQLISAAKGTEIFYDVVPSQGVWTFKTYLGNIEGDFQYPVGPVLSEGGGQIRIDSAGYSAESEITRVYYSTPDPTAAFVELANATREAASPLNLNRREAFISADFEDSLGADLAYALLRESRATFKVVGEVLNVPTFRYGVEWKLGQKWTVEAVGRTVPIIIRRVQLKLDESGNELVTSKFEGVV